MKKILLGLLILLMTLSCSSQSSQKLNPSGVWMHHGIGPLTSISTFSWGKNPVYNQYTAIDLGAKKPIIFTWDGGFYINTFEQKRNRFVFSGTWADGGDGVITIEMTDNDTLWFVSITPGMRVYLGKNEFFKRVPIDANINPIDPAKGP